MARIRPLQRFPKNELRMQTHSFYPEFFKFFLPPCYFNLKRALPEFSQVYYQSYKSPGLCPLPAVNPLSPEQPSLDGFSPFWLCWFPPCRCCQRSLSKPAQPKLRLQGGLHAECILSPS